MILAWLRERRKRQRAIKVLAAMQREMRENFYRIEHAAVQADKELRAKATPSPSSAESGGKE